MALTGDQQDGPPSGPIRMCVGCRARHAQSRLLRFGLEFGPGLGLGFGLGGGADSGPAQVIPTTGARRSHGRSAYLCPRRECLERAVKRRVFTRAFSSAGARRSKHPPNLPQADAHPTSPSASRGTDTISVIGPAAADALWTATADTLRREIDLLDRCAEKTHAQLRRRGLERLLFELSSQPAPSDRRSSANRQGGTPTHG